MAFIQILKNAWSRVVAWYLTLKTTLLLSLGIILGFSVGARLFEMGQLFIRSGSTVKVSGVCNTENGPRRPAFSEDQVKVASVRDGILSGVVRATREDIECDLSKVSADPLPLFTDFFNPPTKVPTITPPVAPKKIECAPFQYANSLLKVTGPCVSEGGLRETLVEEVVDVVSSKATADCQSYDISVVSRAKKKSFECSSASLRYEPTAITEQGVATPYQEKGTVAVDYVGKTILVTGECFPDPAVKEKEKDSSRLSYPANDSAIKVIQAKLVGDQIQFVRGFMIDKRANVICDQSKYPFVYRMFDPSTMRIIRVEDNEANSKGKGR